jgi:hypothetical protein
VASSKKPLRSESVAPVNEPFSWPKSSLSSRFSGSAATFTAMNGRCRRGESRWMPRATSSFPVPLSPRIRTVVLTGAIWTTRSSTSSIASVSPTMPVISRSSSRCTRRRPTSATSSGSTGLAMHSWSPSSRQKARVPVSVGSVRPMTGRRPRSRAARTSARARRSRSAPVTTTSTGTASASSRLSPGASSSTA